MNCWKIKRETCFLTNTSSILLVYRLTPLHFVVVYIWKYGSWPFLILLLGEIMQTGKSWSFYSVWGPPRKASPQNRGSFTQSEGTTVVITDFSFELLRAPVLILAPFSYRSSDSCDGSWKLSKTEDTLTIPKLVFSLWSLEDILLWCQSSILRKKLPHNLMR